MNISQNIDLDFEIVAKGEGEWRYETLHMTKFKIQVPIINGEPIILEIKYAIDDVITKMVASVLAANKAQAEQEAKEAAAIAATEAKLTDISTPVGDMPF